MLRRIKAILDRLSTDELLETHLEHNRKALLEKQQAAQKYKGN